MKMPKTPPDFRKILEKAATENRLPTLLTLEQNPIEEEYIHWDKLRHLGPPSGLTPEDWWAAIKFKRSGSMKRVPLQDKSGRPFLFSVPDQVQMALHEI